MSLVSSRIDGPSQEDMANLKADNERLALEASAKRQRAGVTEGPTEGIELSISQANNDHSEALQLHPTP